VRELLGDPSSEGPCGKLRPAPSKCTNEYIYKYYPEFPFWLRTVRSYIPFRGFPHIIIFLGRPRTRDTAPSGPMRVPQLLTTAFPSGLVRHPSVPS
jgi:hypothetical protein